MSENLITALVSIVVAIIGLAALSVVLSPRAATSQVIGAGSRGLATDIGAAVSPISGGGGLTSLPSLGNGM
jgi:membrane DNA delivery protein